MEDATPFPVTRGKLGVLHSARDIELYACLHQSPRFPPLPNLVSVIFFSSIYKQSRLSNVNISDHSSFQVVGPNMIFVIGSASNTLSSK